MPTPAEHYAEAEKMLDLVDSTPASEIEPEVTLARLVYAQVHATLATAEGAAKGAALAAQDGQP